METIDSGLKTINSSNCELSVHIVFCRSYSGISWVIYANICVSPRVQRIFEWVINCGKFLIWNGSFIFPLSLFIITGHRSRSHRAALLLDKQSVRSVHRPNLKPALSKCKMKGHMQTWGNNENINLTKEFHWHITRSVIFKLFIRICIEGENFERCKGVNSSTSQDMVSQMWEIVSVSIWNLTHEQ